MEKISVIIPVYNTEPYLEKCLDSIVYQTYSDLDVLLINDCSSDGSGEICKKYQEKYSYFRYFEFVENRGVSFARNFGIENAIGSLIGFVDSDDWIEKDMYSILYDLMKTYDSSLASVNYNFAYEKNNIVQKNNGINENVFLDNIIKSLIFYITRNDVILWNKLFKRNLFDGITFPIGKVYEDTSTIYRLIEKAGQAVASREHLYNYLQRSNSITRKKTMSVQAFEHIYVIIERYEYLTARYNCEELEKECRKQIFSVFLSIVDEINHIHLKNLKSINDEYHAAYNAVFNKYSFDDCGLSDLIFNLVSALSKGLQKYKIARDFQMARYI